jgi:hypothetical protein
MMGRRRRIRVRRLTSLLLGIAVIGPASAGAATFSNPASIVVGPDYRGVPYPSTIAVSGATGDVINARATLHAISYPFPEDLDVMLVGPDGSRTLLMSDACTASTLTAATFSFADAASAQLPSASCVGLSGSFKPSNYGTTDEFFFAPAPQGPAPVSLSIFSGRPANGQWQLWAFQDSVDPRGSIAGGWSLDLTLPPTTGTGQRAAARKKCKKRFPPGKKRKKCKRKANRIPL